MFGDIIIALLLGLVCFMCVFACSAGVLWTVKHFKDGDIGTAIFIGVLNVIAFAMTCVMGWLVVSNSHPCEKCHTFTFGTEYCPICGERFENTEVECSMCHTENDSNSKFCRKCGGFLGENDN